MSGANRGRLFLENAAKAAAGTHSVSDTGELLSALGRVVAIDSPVYCPGVTTLEKAVASIFPVRAADYTSAAVTVEEVFGRDRRDRHARLLERRGPGGSGGAASRPPRGDRATGPDLRYARRFLRGGLRRPAPRT